MVLVSGEDGASVILLCGSIMRRWNPERFRGKKRQERNYREKYKDLEIGSEDRRDKEIQKEDVGGKRVGRGSVWVWQTVHVFMHLLES